MRSTKTYKFNEYLELKLENGETRLYICNEEFKICKIASVNLPLNALNKLSSIDEILFPYPSNEPLFIDPNDFFERSNNPKIKISKEEEFWVHSSNLQVWADNEYNAQLLDSSLAFPILKKLSESGDLVARKKFKEEIAKRFSSEFIPAMKFLFLNSYLNFLNQEEKRQAVISIKFLDLSNCGLKSIPDFVFYAKKLEILYLFNNKIQKLSQKFKFL